MLFVLINNICVVCFDNDVVSSFFATSKNCPKMSSRNWNATNVGGTSTARAWSRRRRDVVHRGVLVRFRNSKCEAPVVLRVHDALEPRDTMNCEIHALPPLRCEHFQAPDVCRAVLHTVLFTRALGVVRPRDTQSELFDLTYCTCGDDDVHARIEGKVERLRGWLEDSGDKKNQSETKVVLSFFDASGDVGKTKSHCWEQWRVQIEVVRFCGSQGEGDEEGQNPSTLNAHRVAHALELQDQLRGSLSQILTLAGEKKKHIPPVRYVFYP